MDNILMYCYHTYEGIVPPRERKLRRRFDDFQEYAKPCNLYDFTLGMSPEKVLIRNPHSAYPPWHFDFFEDLCKQMSEEERRRYFPSLKLLYQVFLLKYRHTTLLKERITCFRRSFTLLLRSAESIGPKTVSSLLTECKKALKVKLCDFLNIVPVKDNSAVMRCFPTRRRRRRSVELRRNICRKLLPARWFPTRESVGIGWDVRNSESLMPALLKIKDRCVALIHFGHPYKYDHRYFFWRVTHLLREESRAQIKGNLLSNEISPLIYHSSNLRLQMTVELLLAVFDETRGYDRNILDLVWRAVPFPYISSAEMSTLLSPFFERGDLLQEVCDEYKKRNTMFEVPQVTEPRSLKHLSRVQVRKCMSDANTIGEEAIDGLDIPVALRDYLRLSFREVYFDVLPNPDFLAV